MICTRHCSAGLFPLHTAGHYWLLTRHWALSTLYKDTVHFFTQIASYDGLFAPCIYLHSTIDEYERCSFSRWLGPKSAILSSTCHFIYFSPTHRRYIERWRWKSNICCQWCIPEGAIKFQLNAGSRPVVSENSWSSVAARSCWWGSGKHFGCLQAGLLSTKYGHLPPGKIIIWPFRYAIMDQNYAAAPSTSPVSSSSLSSASS